MTSFANVLSKLVRNPIFFHIPGSPSVGVPSNSKPGHIVIVACAILLISIVHMQLISRMFRGRNRAILVVDN
jgi:hypothetical protein